MISFLFAAASPPQPGAQESLTAAHFRLLRLSFAMPYSGPGGAAMSAALDPRSPAVLPKAEQDIAQEASRAVSRLAGRGRVRVEAEPAGSPREHQSFVLPEPAVQLLMDMLAHLGAGDGVTIIPHQAELTTGQAAEFLNVSRPWVVKLIDDGKLPHRMVGTHRRVLLADLVAYQQRRKIWQHRLLDELAAEGQALGEYE
jgi:excisionase family DNA binding protein